MIQTLTDPAQAEAVADVAAITFPLACPPHSRPENIAAHIATELSPDRFAAWIAADDHDVLVARDGDALIGYTLIVYGLPADPDVAAVVPADGVAEISKMYVLPDHHGAGVSHRLMEAALDAARRHGATTAWLGVNDENDRAVAYYRKMGFEIVGDKSFDMNGVIEHDHVMARSL
ncbi:MAG: GNAT family N-acetyltransferase [Gordonia sp. (in: high G+C Gram-positive bacteria)]|uniref:GNAT family N-acetyltransferase n=1 Tax=Gordonia sp. (in: high G+C Gram-positive bacteria) TaxID=84139 RepID=UPI0039E7059D